MSLLWKIGGGAVALLAAYLLVTMYGAAREHSGRDAERAAWQQKVADAEKGKLLAYQAGLLHSQAAEQIYHETIRTLPPVTNTIVERSTAYAATPAGAAMCLPAERVLWLEQTRRALFPAAPAPAAGSGAGAVLADPAHPQP